MTRVREIIETTRLVAPTDGDTFPFHTHGQHYTTDGELIVEWCEWSGECEKVKEPVGVDVDE